MVIYRALDNAAAQPVEAPRNSVAAFLAPDLQTASLRSPSGVDNRIVQKAGLSSAEDLIGSDWTPSDLNEKMEAQVHNPFNQYEASEPKGLDDFSKLSAENVSKVNDLKRAGIRGSQNQFLRDV